MEARRVVRHRGSHSSEVVSLIHQLPFTPRKIPGTHFYQRLNEPQGHSAAGRIRSIEKYSDLIGNQTHDLPACSIVPQLTVLLHAPFEHLPNVNVEARMVLGLFYIAL
jgi:hypothetical protein